MTVKIEHELNKVSAKLLKFNTAAKRGIEPVFRKFVTDIYTDITLRSPVDKGQYRADWELKSLSEPEYLVSMKIVNNMSYSGVMELGSPVGGNPWPNAGPKTVVKDGRVWSNQMPEPVAGGAVESADYNGLLKEISKSIDGVL
jgi:hypothetical protein